MSAPKKLVPLAASGRINLSGLNRAEITLANKVMEHLSGAIDCVAKAAEAWIQMQPETQLRFIDSTPSSMRHVWERLDAVGRGTLAPQLVLMNGRGPMHLAKLPVDQQEQYLAEKIPVLIDNKMHELAVTELSGRQVKQVFSVRGKKVSVRSIPKQRAWLKRQEQIELKNQSDDARHASRKKIVRDGKWRAERGKVYFNDDFASKGITATDLRAALRDLRP